MSVKITIEEAQVSLKELVHGLAPGEEVIITENQLPVARLVCEPATTAKPRAAPGLGKGRIIYMAPDFDAPLDEFKEYME